MRIYIRDKYFWYKEGISNSDVSNLFLWSSNVVNNSIAFPRQFALPTPGLDIALHRFYKILSVRLPNENKGKKGLQLNQLHKVVMLYIFSFWS